MRIRWPWPGEARTRGTLLWISGTRLVRADFKGMPEPVLEGLWESVAPVGVGVPEWVEAAWMLGPAGPRRVQVLTDAVATLGLAIPAGKVAGLEGTGLGRALAFEAEAVTGLGPFDVAQGWVGGGAQEGVGWYWVSQVLRTEVEKMSALLAAKGAVLEGVLHPGGLPRRIGAGTGGWQRIELWDERVVCVDGVAPQAARVRVIDTPPSRSGWQGEVSDWFQPFMGERGILSPTSALARQGPGLAKVLEDEETLRAWLQGWATELASDAGRVPVIRWVPSAVAEAGGRRWAAGALAAGVAMVCGGHVVWARSRESGLRRDLDVASRPAVELAGHRRRTTELQAQVAESRKERQGLEELRGYWKDTLDREHRRHATLLRVLAVSMPDGVMLGGLAEGPGEMRVSGISLVPGAAGLGPRVGAAMESFGWRAEPPTRRSLGLLPGGGPWQVEWTLRVIAPPPGGPIAGLTNVAAGLSREAARTSVMAVGLPGRDEGGGR